MSINIIDHKEAISVVREHHNTSIRPDVMYHNIALTEHQLGIAKNLIKKEGLEDPQAGYIYTALAFLYLGYRQEKDLSLEQGRNLARRFLEGKSYSTDAINEVIQLMKIADTKKPETTSEEIISDVLHAYLGEKGIKKVTHKLWVEHNMVANDKEDYIDQLEKTYERIKRYRFKTKTGIKRFDKRRQRNLNKLYKEIFEYQSSAELQNNKAALTMFKTEMRNQVDLISIADQKAGIMISINALLLTILLPVFASYLIDMSQFLVPALILLLTCGLSIILAAFATRPDKMKGELKESNAQSGRKSVLAFTNFYKMDREEYYEAVVQNMSREKAFESSIINHIYDFGQTLGEKYKRLRLTYIIFATGIGLTVITIVLAMMVPLGF